jgi:hypothetical protein
MVLAGLAEEIIKFIVYIAPLLVGRMKTGFQLMYMALFAGLSFGVIENIFYCSANLRGAVTDDIMGTEQGSEILRAGVGFRLFNTCIIHSSLSFVGSIILCYSYTGIVERIPRWAMYILALVVPAALHGFYDVALMIEPQDGGYPALFADVISISYPIIVLALIVPIIRRTRATSSAARRGRTASRP